MMTLNDQLILYPEGMTPDSIVSAIKRVLGNPLIANSEIWKDERYDWPNFIARICWEYGVNPIWILISLQRERGLFGKSGSERDFDFSQGVVGQDAPGTSNPRWNGLPTQIFMSARAVAWLADIGPNSNFGYKPGLAPSGKRWKAPSTDLDIYDWETHKPSYKYTACTMAEYVQLKFTPHLDVIETNGAIFEKWVSPFWY